MPLILNIDTALEAASVSLSQGGKLLQAEVNERQRDHAAWIHHAIHRLFRESGHQLSDLKAVSVSIGPGSYTGLRIGLSTAKGLCYALQKPLITVGTLELIAYAAMPIAVEWICPMIDARRMEVYMALYDKSMTQILPPSAMILNQESFRDVMNEHHITFAGIGSRKFEEILPYSNMTFIKNDSSPEHLATIATQHFLSDHTADLAYVEPLYVKEFYTGNKS